mgnify:CR=1 FL=1
MAPWRCGAERGGWPERKDRIDFVLGAAHLGCASICRFHCSPVVAEVRREIIVEEILKVALAEESIPNRIVEVRKLAWIGDDGRKPTIKHTMELGTDKKRHKVENKRGGRRMLRRQSNEDGAA